MLNTFSEERDPKQQTPSSVVETMRPTTEDEARCLPLDGDCRRASAQEDAGHQTMLAYSSSFLKKAQYSVLKHLGSRRSRAIFMTKPSSQLQLATTWYICSSKKSLASRWTSRSLTQYTLSRFWPTQAHN